MSAVADGRWEADPRSAAWPRAETALRVAMVVHLGLGEARRLARHPYVLLGAALSGVMLTATGGRMNGAFELLSGILVLPVAVAACAAAHAASSRERRDATVELLTTLPASERARTAALLLGLLGPVGVGVALVAVAFVATGAWDGVPVALLEGVVDVRPVAAELLQGPLAVLALGALGLLLGPLVPARALGPVLLVGLFALLTFGMWNSEGWWRWAMPVTHHEQLVVRWVQVTPGWGYSIVSGYDRVALAWHDAYLAGLAALLGALALLRARRDAPVIAAAVGLLALTGVLSVVQVP